MSHIVLCSLNILTIGSVQFFCDNPDDHGLIHLVAHHNPLSCLCETTTSRLPTPSPTNLLLLLELHCRHSILHSAAIAAPYRFSSLTKSNIDDFAKPNSTIPPWEHRLLPGNFRFLVITLCRRDTCAPRTSYSIYNRAPTRVYRTTPPGFTQAKTPPFALE